MSLESSCCRQIWIRITVKNVNMQHNPKHTYSKSMSHWIQQNLFSIELILMLLKHRTFWPASWIHGHQGFCWKQISMTQVSGFYYVRTCSACTQAPPRKFWFQHMLLTYATAATWNPGCKEIAYCLFLGAFILEEQKNWGENLGAPDLQKELTMFWMGQHFLWSKRYCS